MEWEPFTEATLQDKIIAAEGRMNLQLFRLREAINISPETWAEKTYGVAGGGFWVVAIIDSTAIWYNDIEDGFNCSRYTTLGKLAEYWRNQNEVEHAVQNVLHVLQTGQDLAGRCGPPIAVQEL